MTDAQSTHSYQILHNYMRQLFGMSYRQECSINGYLIKDMGYVIYISDKNYSFSIMIKEDVTVNPTSPIISWVYNRSGKNLSPDGIVSYIVREIKLMEILG